MYRPYSGSERASLEINTQEASPLTTTPTGIESIRGPLQQLSDLHKKANPDSTMEKVRGWVGSRSKKLRVRETNRQIQAHGEAIAKLPRILSEDVSAINTLIRQALEQTELARKYADDEGRKIPPEKREAAVEELEKIGHKIENWKESLVDRKGLSPKEIQLNTYIASYFRDTFASILGDKRLDVPLSDLQNFDPHMPVRDVVKKYNEQVAKAFAIARGRTSIERCKRTPYRQEEVERLKGDYTHKAVYSFGGTFTVNTQSKEYGGYTCLINPAKGEIDILSTERTGGLHLDNVLHEQHKRVLSKIGDGEDDNHEELSIDVSNLRKYHQVTHSDITNSETKDTMDLFMQGAQNETHGEGTELYEVVLGTPNGIGMSYFVKNHQDILVGPEIQSIELRKTEQVDVDRNTEIILEDIRFSISSPHVLQSE